ncbi:MAG: hypothetical protein IKG03_04790 [Clostridiales bacterium]|nr:hypothetical protein [Clostridiales bacterium]
MRAPSIGRKITSLLLCASLAGALFTGCKKGDDMFPEIVSPGDQTEPAETSDETTDPSDVSDICQLNVALPYSDQTIQCLAAMLFCKNNGLWDSSDTGLTVDTDYLSSVATNYVVTNIGCGSTGTSLDTVREWSGKDEVPDLFLAQDSEAVWKAGYASDLNAYLSDNSYLNSQNIYTGALTADSENGVFFAVPHYCSAKIILGNVEFIPSESGKLPTKNTTDDLRDYLEEINAEYTCAAFASAYELIPYLGSAFNNDVPTSYMVYDEYSEDHESAKVIINDASSYVRGFYSDSLAQDLIDGADPVYSRKAALWVDSSANIRAWSEYFPGSLYLLHLPCNDASNIGVSYLSTYSLCVYKKSQNREFASQFAAFISYDPDAQLLIYRLENMTGLMPLTRNDAIWDLVSDDELFGHMASDFRQTMDNAVYCPDSYDSKVFTRTNEYTAEFVKQEDEFDPEKCYG